MAQGNSQARLGRGGVEAREDCTSGEALRLTVTVRWCHTLLTRPLGLADAGQIGVCTGRRGASYGAPG